MGYHLAVPADCNLLTPFDQIEQSIEGAFRFANINFFHSMALSPSIVFPAKAGTHFCHGYRLSPA